MFWYHVWHLQGIKRKSFCQHSGPGLSGSISTPTPVHLTQWQEEEEEEDVEEQEINSGSTPKWGTQSGFWSASWDKVQQSLLLLPQEF